MYSYQIKEKIKSYCPLMKCVCNLFSSSYGIGKTRGSQTFGDWGILFILVVFFFTYTDNFDKESINERITKGTQMGFFATFSCLNLVSHSQDIPLPVEKVASSICRWPPGGVQCLCRVGNSFLH